MLRFKLNKKLSKEIRKNAGKVIELQEERCPVVKKQLELAFMDENFASLVARCRNREASYPDRDAAWEALMEVLPSKRLDHHSMRQDAASYYTEKLKAAQNSLLSEVIRETYDLMTLYLYDGIDFGTESYSITDLSSRLGCLSDGFHHFFCDAVFGGDSTEIIWGELIEDLPADETARTQLADLFERFEFGWWEIYTEGSKMYFDIYNEGAKIPKQKIRKCAITIKLSATAQPFAGDAVRVCARLMLENPDMKQTAFKEMAVAEDSFGLGDDAATAQLAVVLYKRLSTLHEPLLSMIPEMNAADLSVINTIARMRCDYLFYIFMIVPYEHSAALKIFDEANMLMNTISKQALKKPLTSSFEAMTEDFFSPEDGMESGPDDQKIHDDMLAFLDDADLIGRNQFGQMTATPPEITPRLLHALINHGYSAYLRPILGHYRFERTETALDFMGEMSSLFELPEDNLCY